RARQIYELLEPHAPYTILAGMPAASLGSAELFLALAAGTFGDWKRADAHLATAIERNLAAGNRTWTIRSRQEYAELLVRQGHDLDRARALLEELAQEAGELGMTRVATRAREWAGRC